jgi:beta-mannosidase
LIYETGDIRIDSMRIVPLLLDDGTAVLTFDVGAENYGKEPRMVEASLKIQPDNFVGETLTREWEELLPPGRTQIHRVVQMKNPSLWWTWEHGEQNLYRAELGFYQDQQLQDERSERFGVREVTVDKEHGWKLNGKPFFPRGTNVIPAQWLAEYDEAKIAKDIALLRDANVNAVRVHAHVTRSEFYEACDEAGILVWQDFPLQWSYEESEEFYNNAARQLREMIALLHNHPSIGVWCCHNEPSTNTGTLDNFLYRVAKEADGSRYIEHHSDYRDHPYPGWYYGHWTLFASVPGAPFVSEFGAQALPNLDTMKRMLPMEKLWPPDWEAWTYHDFQYDQTFNVAEIRTGDSLEEFVKNSQEYQYKLLKLAIESYRRDPRMTGIFQFMFMDPWPSITWSVIDYWRNPKKGYKALQIGFQPVLISFITGRDRFVEGARDAFIISDVVIINDLNQALPHTEVHLWFEDEGGKPLIEETCVVDIPANDQIHVSTPMMKSRRWMLPKGVLAGRYTLHSEVIHEEGIISKNEQEFVVLARK